MTTLPSTWPSAAGRDATAVGAMVTAVAAAGVASPTSWREPR